MKRSCGSILMDRPCVVASSLLLLSFLVRCSGENQFASDDNKQFVPEDEDAPFCSIPPYQNTSLLFEPTDGLCETDDILLDDDDAIQQLAQAYAPFLYFHPREKWTMSSVERTFGDVRSYCRY